MRMNATRPRRLSRRVRSQETCQADMIMRLGNTETARAGMGMQERATGAERPGGVGAGGGQRSEILASH
eukprot:767009-Hanusia_phi.AAC.9